MKDVITVRNLSKKFIIRTNKNLITGLFKPEWEYFQAVNSIDFSIQPNESVAFLGPNGAGKTTTTKMLTGLMYPTSGEIKVLGHEPFKRNYSFLAQIGLLMGNKAGLNWDLTARQSFWLLRHMYDIPQNEFDIRVRNLSGMLAIDNRLDTQVRRLSLGERMKVELIGSLLHKPKVLFLDEPTIGLDIEAKIQVRNFLKKIKKEDGATILLTSHDMDDIDQVCERVLVINEGSIIYDDSIEKLQKQTSDDRYMRLHFNGDYDIGHLKQLGVIIEERNGVLLKVSRTDVPDVLAKIVSVYSIEDVSIESTPLEMIISRLF